MQEPAVLNKKWEYSNELARKDIDSFRKDIDDIDSIHLEYSILLTQYIDIYQPKHKKYSDAEQSARRGQLKEEGEEEELINRLMKLNENLVYVFGEYLNIPRVLHRLQANQIIFRKRLKANGYNDIVTTIKVAENSEKSTLLQELTQLGNFPRNFFARLRRVGLALPPILEDMNATKANKLIKNYDAMALKGVSHAAWVFFLPRLLTNLFLLLKHTINPEGIISDKAHWMSKRERDLGWQFRLKIQLKRRGIQLGSDTMWISLGLLNAFLFTGVLAPIGMMVTVGVLAMDVIIAIIQCQIAVSRHETLLDKYKKDLKKNSGNRDTISLIAHTEQRLSFTRKQLSIQIVSTTILFTAFCFSGLIFVVNPYLGLACVSIAVAVTLATFIGRRLYDEKMPDDKLIDSTVPRLPISPTFIKTSSLLAALCFSAFLVVVNPYLALACVSVALAVCLATFIARKICAPKKTNEEVAAQPVAEADLAPNNEALLGARSAPAPESEEDSKTPLQRNSFFNCFCRRQTSSDPSVHHVISNSKMA